MRRLLTLTMFGAALLTAATANANFSGSVAQLGCGSLVPDIAAAGGELYVVKTKNPGGGPYFKRDWLFDLSAKGGGATPGSSAGGPTWSVFPNFEQNVVNADRIFAIVIFPGGLMSIDSIAASAATTLLGAVQRQHVGDSLPVGQAAGIGLTLPGDASPYSASLVDRHGGAAAMFPYGTATGIEVAFAPIAEINTTDLNGSGCTIGGEVEEEDAAFGFISGYNVFRVQGLPGLVPTTADFVGNWQYYLPYNSFNLALADTPGATGPDLNGDTLPDGDATPAPSDSLPNDLAGLQNPDGIPHSGDEVLIYSDAAKNPNGTPRLSGSAPDGAAGVGYWYAFQPVGFQGVTLPTDYDGLGFSNTGDFPGQHSVDADADGIAESIDLDLDGSIEFYSPQIVTGQTGVGLTHGGLPLLSSPVYGQLNPAAAIGDARISGAVVGRHVHLTISTGFETSSRIGYNVYRITADGRASRVNDELIPAQGGEGNVYALVDPLPVLGRRLGRDQRNYRLEIVVDGGASAVLAGPFAVEVAATPLDRRRR